MRRETGDGLCVEHDLTVRLQNIQIIVACNNFQEFGTKSMNRTGEKNLTVNPEFFLLGFQSSQHFNIFLFINLLLAYCGTICGNLLIIALVSSSKKLHTPMYFFISQLSISDIVLTTDIVPNTLHVLMNNGGVITFTGCITQFYFFSASEVFECLLLTVMSYDRYVAICNPLRYTSIMTSSHCVILATMCWVIGFLVALIYCLTLSMLTYCVPSLIDHFFCDLVPLLEIACSSTYIIELEVYIMCLLVMFIPITIIISYVKIIVAILRFQSSTGRQKAFSTCSSHLIVVSIFYFTILIVYFFPKEGQTLNLRKILSLLYTVFTPLINPIIYSLRNKEIKKSLQEIMKLQLVSFV
ncbi:olfactory receptor 2A7-like [Anomaloglossus baeobatrachus]